MATSTAYTLRARYILPIDRVPIRDGWIAVSNGCIREIGHGRTAPGDCRDLGDVAILPGLVNAHTHLEFSTLDGPLGQRGMPFTEWIREVIRWRRRTLEQQPAVDPRREAVRRGLDECLRGGTTALGEIATMPCRGTELRDQRMQGACFLELLALAPARRDQLLAAASDYLAACDNRGLPFQAGLSPHAPYTVSPQLVSSAVSLSARTRTPIAMHLAETREEIDLLRSGAGPFRQLLEELDAWYPGVIPADSKPLDYLHQLSDGYRSLVIHGNYFSSEEIEFAGARSDRMSVIYCARTHDYFGHQRYRLREMFEAGVNVALGTDSRASNPDLNMLSELRFAAQQHPDISLDAILRLATINAARALGVQQTLGTLTPGKQADFVVLPVSPNDRRDPHELIFESAEAVRQVFRAGQEFQALNHNRDSK